MVPVEEEFAELVPIDALSFETACEYPNWDETARQSRIVKKNIFLWFWAKRRPELKMPRMRKEKRQRKKRDYSPPFDTSCERHETVPTYVVCAMRQTIIISIYDRLRQRD